MGRKLAEDARHWVRWLLGDEARPGDGHRLVVVPMILVVGVLMVGLAVGAGSLAGDSASATPGGGGLVVSAPGYSTTPTAVPAVVGGAATSRHRSAGGPTVRSRGSSAAPKRARPHASTAGARTHPRTTTSTVPRTTTTRPARHG